MKHRRALELGATAALVLTVAGTSLGLYRLHEYRREQARVLIRATIAGDAARVRRLLDRGADPNTWDGATPILYYAVSVDSPEVTRLLVERGAVIDTQTPAGETPLVAATRGGMTSMARLLLELGADPNCPSREGGETPLITAARLGHRRIAELALEHGADVNVRDTDGSTPLHWAAYWGREEMARLLLAAGADVGAQDGKGRTAAALAGERGFPAIARLLRASARRESRPAGS